jgi:LysR family hydrogen peroxide-inducible transcriptional activator
VLKLCQTELQQDQRINMESGNFDTLVKLAHRGLGMTLLPYLNTLDLASKYKKGIKPIAEPTPAREISMLYTRTQLKQEWIKAMAAVIQSTLPEKLLEKSDHIISP